MPQRSGAGCWSTGTSELGFRGRGGAPRKGIEAETAGVGENRAGTPRARLVPLAPSWPPQGGLVHVSPRRWTGREVPAPLGPVGRGRVSGWFAEADPAWGWLGALTQTSAHLDPGTWAPDPLGCNCRQHATCRRRSGRGPFSSSSRWRVLPSLVVVAAVERPEAATLGSYPAFRSLTWKRAVLYHRLGPSILSHALRACPGLRARWPIQSGARPRAPPRACEPAFEGRVLCRQRPSS